MLQHDFFLCGMKFSSNLLANSCHGSNGINYALGAGFHQIDTSLLHCMEDVLDALSNEVGASVDFVRHESRRRQGRRC